MILLISKDDAKILDFGEQHIIDSSKNYDLKLFNDDYY